MFDVIDENGEIRAKFADLEDAQKWARPRMLAVFAGETEMVEFTEPRDSVTQPPAECPTCHCVMRQGGICTICDW